MKDFKKLEKKLKIKFNDINLLRQAFVHRSYLNEHPSFKLKHNERLEFLGDAVLEFIVTEYLYRKYPKRPEGEMTNWRAALVNSNMLSKKSRELELEPYLFLSKGESKDTGKAREIILANTFEALIGAIYLDQEYNTVKQFIEKYLLPELPYILKHELYLDPKSKLQEIIQDKFGITPIYQVLKEWGPDHAKQFEIGVYLDTQLLGKGTESSKQGAQIKAAEDALLEKRWRTIR